MYMYILSESAEGKQGMRLLGKICELVFDPVFEVLWKKAKSAKAFPKSTFIL